MSFVTLNELNPGNRIHGQDIAGHDAPAMPHQFRGNLGPTARRAAQINHGHTGLQ
jgi:hypothetical protein